MIFAPLPLHARRRALLALSACAGLVLSGCAQVTRAPDPLKQPAAPGQSPVVLSITSNTAQAGAFDTLVASRVLANGQKSSDSYELEQALPGLSRDTTLFIGALPEGEYEFTTLRSNATNKFITLTADTRRLLGRFVVRSGRPVDLGRLIVTPMNSRVLIGRSARVASNAALLQRFAPEHARLFAGVNETGWLAPRKLDDRVEDYALARPVGANQPQELADGTIVAASRLGTVLVRTPATGRWRAVRSDGLASLLHAVPVDLPNAQLLAVGEFGTLLRLPPGGDKLVPIDSGDLPPGNLLLITGDAARGWVVALQHGDDVSLLHSERLDAGRWRVLRSENVGRDFWNGTNRLWVWATRQGLSYALSDGSIHHLDLSSGAWQSRKAPGNQRLIAVAPDPGGHTGILTSPGGGIGGVFASTYRSSDGGQNWVEVKPDFSVKISPPRRAGSGDLLMVGGVFSTPELHSSQDGGRTWRKTAAFTLDQDLVVLPSGALLGVSLGQQGLFGIRHSSNEGRTWRMEYSNFDRDADEATRAR